MNTISFLIEVVLPYLSVGIFVVSTLFKIKKWFFLPHTLKWSLYPMPVTTGEQISFMLKEILTFKSVLHNNRKLWFGGWLFHIGIALIALWFICFLIGLHAGIILRVGLSIIIILPAYILAMRVISKRMRAISSPIDYLNLCIFIFIGILGFLVLHDPSVQSGVVRQYFINFLMFHPNTVSQSGEFILLLATVEFFMIYFPNSKMLHMVSKYFAFHKINWESH